MAIQEMSAPGQQSRKRAPWVPLPWDEPDGSLPRLDSRPATARWAPYARGLKRAMDVFISLVALAVYAPALAVLALIIRADSRGPVIFLQPRIGIDRRRHRVHMPATAERRHVINPGRPFNIIKLRTMAVDAEAGGPQLAEPNDARVTRVGRFLRRSRLDEFPQFVNVLRGEMSVVGPRPERLCFISRLEHDVPGYCRRLDVLPGITGLAQVLNGYDTDVDSVRRKVHLDRQYINRLSLQTDLRILALTVKVVISGKGAR